MYNIHTLSSILHSLLLSSTTYYMAVSEQGKDNKITALDALFLSTQNMYHKA